MRKTLTALALGLATNVSGQVIAPGSPAHFREDFENPGLSFAFEQNNSANWRNEGSKRRVLDSTEGKGYGQSKLLFKNQQYGRNDNYAVSCKVDREEFDYSTDHVGVIFAGKDMSDYYYFGVSKVQGQGFNWLISRQRPSSNQNFANGVIPIDITLPENTLTVRVKPEGVEAYINNTFITVVPPIPEDYSGYVGLYANDSSFNNEAPARENRFDDFEVILDDRPLDFVPFSPNLLITEQGPQMQFQIPTLVGRPYTLQSTTNLVNWSDVRSFNGVTNASSTSITLTNLDGGVKAFRVRRD